MADRAYGADPERAAEMGVAVIEGLQEKGVMAVGKHFPGIGRTVLDSHHDLPAFDGTRADLEAVELPPFAAAIRAGVAGVMLSHIRYDRLDSEWPASLSVRIARELLRDEMGFEGLVLTDDLDMGAISKHFNIETAAGRILAAEVDMAIICHSLDALQQAHRLIRDHLADGRFDGESSANRIMGLKSRFLPI
jgi:beta-N-acetylhexosaminidase